MMRLFRGMEYAGILSKFVPGPRLYPFGSKRLVVRDGIRYELDPSCMMQWYVYWNFHETQRDMLYSLIREGDVVFDVGTNIGETLLHFSRLVGKEGFVYGFEPDEVNYAAGMRNVALNKAENTKIFNLGVSDKRETLRLFRVDPNNLGMNRILNEEEAAKFDDFTEINVDTLDNVVRESRIERVDVIKIDIEGYEMHALRGGVETLRRFKPKLFIEVGYTRLIQNGTSPTELVSFLEETGYEIYHAETNERITPAFDFAPLGDGGIDVVALPR